MINRQFLVILLISMLMLFSCADLRHYKQTVQTMEINEVDLNQIEDGVYTGEYDLKLVSAIVKVEVKDHKIISIDLVEHNNGRGADAEVIPGTVVKAQTLKVDTITGATSSSKVILKAIEFALTGEKQQVNE